MTDCCIWDLILLFVLSFTPYSGTLTCHKGIMLKFGRGFSETPIEWNSFGNMNSEPEELCQETLLLIDVGAKSLIVGSKGSSQPGGQKTKYVRVYSSGPGIVAASYVNFCDTDLCNAANTSRVLLDGLHVSASTGLGTTECPVCLQFRGSCTQNSNFVFCPKGTGCYAGDIEIKESGVNAIFSIDGCLVSSAKYLFHQQYFIGVFSVMEMLDRPMENYSPSYLLFPGTSLAWVSGLGLFLILCLEGCVLSD